MSTILDLSQVLSSIKSLEDIQSTNITFEFQLQESKGQIGAIFRACNNVFALTITAKRIVIANEAILIDEPIELQEDETYLADCGIKTDYGYRHFVLYARISQTVEVPQAFYKAFEDTQA
jgi:hypothetical protein